MADKESYWFVSFPKPLAFGPSSLPLSLPCQARWSTGNVQLLSHAQSTSRLARERKKLDDIDGILFCLISFLSLLLS